MALIARDLHNVSAALRVGGAMKDRRAPRGGARNLQAEYLDQAYELDGIEEETEADVCLAGGPCRVCDAVDVEDLALLGGHISLEVA